jgi:hypothetical protein
MRTAPNGLHKEIKGFVHEIIIALWSRDQESGDERRLCGEGRGSARGGAIFLRIFPICSHDIPPTTDPMTESQEHRVVTLIGQQHHADNLWRQ